MFKSAPFRFAGHTLLLLLLALSVGCSTPRTKPNEQRWEKEIQAFEQSDRTNPPPREAILFAGSSSIRKWTTLTQDFAGLPVINRGFGGSEIADSTYFADRIIVPCQPKIIVMYAGDNDLASGKTPRQLYADFRGFLSKIHSRLPDTRIMFISIKPSTLRWKLHAQQEVANRKIAAIKDPKFEFIDIYPAMLGFDGKPRPDLLLKDGLHPSLLGYAVWTSLIKPRLEAEWKQQAQPGQNTKNQTSSSR